MTGVVFDIQHYAVHDGPGIRTLVFLKGCPLRCQWCCNPESQQVWPELRHLQSRCRACGRCVQACPAGALAIAEGALVIDRGRCRECPTPLCVPACNEPALALSGAKMDVDAVMTRVAADLDFYRNSGGGVTFSGGEPFAQPEFLLELLERSRSLGISTAVETCGHAETDAFLITEPLIDLFLFDLKLADSDEHRRWTGVGNERILANLTSLAAGHQNKIILRVPIVPGRTDSPENITAIAGIARGHGLSRIELQPYHPLGLPKYGEIGRPVPTEVLPPGPADLEGLVRRLSDLGFAAEIA